uniref:Kinase n=2 Tax=Hemiselmis andersenii TaxID=464988 RepID=A0A7S1DYY4_HEMAN|mmetsp:Transcript_32441/g.79123  ORF Transcript_32441/g.79123 Transcript_32441/m.79123 type:complete len:194 (+) Transcript_32441:30-611(+)
MYDKVWGNQLKFDEFGDGIAKFFDNGSRRRRVLAKRFVEMLQPLRKMMAEQGLYRFYASSILFIYEGSEEPEEEVEVGDNWLEQCDLECKANVKMIDFAHVFPIGEGHGSRDNSYRCGLDNLLRVLEGIGNGLSGNEFKLIDHSGHDELHVHCLCGQDPVRSDWNYMSGSRSGNCTPLEKTPAKTPASSPVVY